MWDCFLAGTYHILRRAGLCGSGFFLPHVTCHLNSFFSAVGPPGPPGKYPFCIFLVQGQLWVAGAPGSKDHRWWRGGVGQHPIHVPILSCGLSQWLAEITSPAVKLFLTVPVLCTRTSRSWWVTRTQWIRWTAWSPGTKRRKRSKREERKNG